MFSSQKEESVAYQHGKQCERQHNRGSQNVSRDGGPGGNQGESRRRRKAACLRKYHGENQAIAMTGYKCNQVGRECLE